MKGRYTETALHSVIATIEKSLSLKEYTLEAFLDIEGAFNNGFPEAITGALTGLGIEGRLVGLINQLLTGHSSILLKQNNIPSKADYCMPIEYMTTPFHTLIPRREEWAVRPPGEPLSGYLITVVLSKPKS
ncbi:hypothetical protein ACLKA7_007602 [Drosophila subpalustris]